MASFKTYSQDSVATPCKEISYTKLIATNLNPEKGLYDAGCGTVCKVHVKHYKLPFGAYICPVMLFHRKKYKKYNLKFITFNKY